MRTFLLAATLVPALAFGMPALAQSTSTDTTSTQSGAVRLSIKDNVRAVSVSTLQDTLYDLIALKQNGHQAHWNVVGSDFYQLHEFYGELYTGLREPIDKVAERKRALEEPADGRPAQVAEQSNIKPLELGELKGDETNIRLRDDYATMSNLLNERIETVKDDPITQDLLIGIAHMIDKHFWQLRAHTQ